MREVSDSKSLRQIEQLDDDGSLSSESDNIEMKVSSKSKSIVEMGTS